mmetsp:Transcript_29902/g.56075  ORF Transcript_29902/g.56075 Transcript_29902/m.56075 type:complete len:285 (+) Transcript_29902:126-980(+)
MLRATRISLRLQRAPPQCHQLRHDVVVNDLSLISAASRQMRNRKLHLPVDHGLQPKADRNIFVGQCLQVRQTGPGIFGVRLSLQNACNVTAQGRAEKIPSASRILREEVMPCHQPVGSIRPFASGRLIRPRVALEGAPVDPGSFFAIFLEELLRLEQRQKTVHEDEGVGVHFQQQAEAKVAHSEGNAALHFGREVSVEILTRRNLEHGHISKSLLLEGQARRIRLARLTYSENDLHGACAAASCAPARSIQVLGPGISDALALLHVLDVAWDHHEQVIERKGPV